MTRYIGRCPKCHTRLVARPKAVTWDDLWEDFRKLLKSAFSAKAASPKPRTPTRPAA
jgi:hypothetical protein